MHRGWENVFMVISSTGTHWLYSSICSERILQSILGSICLCYPCFSLVEVRVEPSRTFLPEILA